MNTQKTFKMLIGDDSFANPGCIKDSLVMVLLGIGNISGIRVKAGRLENGIYKCDSFPLLDFSGAEIFPVSNVKAMVQEGRKEYDFIVTDFDYGMYSNEDGIDVLRAIKDNPATKVLFTSTDDQRLLDKLGQEVVKYGASLVSGDFLRPKALVLGEFIGKYYQNQNQRKSGN